MSTIVIHQMPILSTFDPPPGFRLQFQRERAFARLAGRLLAGEGLVADLKNPPLD